MLLAARGRQHAPLAQTRARCISAAAEVAREWQLMPSGLRVLEVSKGERGDFPVKDNQTVRVTYAVRLDDGVEVIRRSGLSYKIGNGSVCEALSEGVLGMRVGDRRRLRAPPSLRRSAEVATASPADEIIEYEVQLTGAVHHMEIITLDEPGSDDPLQELWDAGKRSIRAIFGGGDRTSSSSKTKDHPKMSDRTKDSIG